MILTKTEAKKILQRDFIPGGGTVDVSKVKFQRTKEHEVFRCGCKVGNDSQSGPLYCGDIAEFVAPVEDGIVAVCERCARRLPKESFVEE